MRRGTWTALHLSALVLLAAFGDGCSTSPRPDPPAMRRPASADGTTALDSSDRTETAAGLRRELRRAEADPFDRESLRLFVECRDDGQMRSVSVFGDGIGIWNAERQFSMDRGQLRVLLAALKDADFPGLEDTYGGSAGLPSPSPSPVPDPEMLVTVVTCRVELELGGFRKQVVQLARGEQSLVLKKLAQHLLRTCEAPARSGQGARSLQHGLQAIARGELAFETWIVVLHRVPEEDGGGAPGFLLRVSGSEAVTQAYRPATGYEEPVTLKLDREEVRALASELGARDPGAWPVNLYARDYTDLSIEVLNHKKTVQARQFAGLAPTSQGRHQRDFEEVVELFGRLHRRVLDQGR